MTVFLLLQKIGDNRQCSSAIFQDYCCHAKPSIWGNDILYYMMMIIFGSVMDNVAYQKKFKIENIENCKNKSLFAR